MSSRLPKELQNQSRAKGAGCRGERPRATKGSEAWTSQILQTASILRCMQKHRHQEFIRFLNPIEAQVPANKAVQTLSSTTMRPTSTRKSANGSIVIRASPSISRPLRPRGSMPSRASSPSSQDAASSPGSSDPSATSIRSTSAAPQVTLRSSQIGKYVYVLGADSMIEKLVSRSPSAIDIAGSRPTVGKRLPPKYRLYLPIAQKQAAASDVT